MVKEILITFDDILNISDKETNEIEKEVYRKFLKEAGSNDNSTMRGIFEKSRKALTSQELKSRIKEGLLSLKVSSMKKLVA